MSFVRGINPIWSFVDLQGKQLDDTYYLFTLQNTLPYLPSPIWQDFEGNVPWSDPIQFLANGTLPENMYWDEDQVYRLEIRKGPTQDDPLIYLVENYVPGSGGDTPTGEAITTSNQITNPQFSLINFNSPYTTSLSTVDVAPGWRIEASGGAGTITVTRVAVQGSDNVINNPPYYLRVASTGWTTISLIQRFNQNGGLWSNRAVSMNVTASCTAPFVQLNSFINNSIGQSTPVFVNQPLNASFNEISEAASIPASTNTNIPPNAYTECVISWAAGTTVNITSIQLIGQDDAIALNYEENTVERQIDQTFNVYAQPLILKPISSYLVGWYFPFNPAQFGTSVGPVATGNNKSFYGRDQTIVFQSVTNGITVSENSAADILFTANADTSFSVIQYLPANNAIDILSSPCAARLNGFTDKVGGITGTVKLYWTTDVSLPDIKSPTFNSLVSSITSGVPSVANGAWTEIPFINPGNSTLSLSFNTQTQQSFNYFNATTPPSYLTAKYFAIVVTFDTLPTGKTVSLKYCSLVPGVIASSGDIKTQDEVLRECSYYYESSYPIGTSPGTAATPSAYVYKMNSTASAGNFRVFANAIQQDFISVKRAIPIVDLYNPVTGTKNSVKTYYIDANFPQPGTSQDNPIPSGGQWTSILTTKSFCFVGNGIDMFTAGGAAASPVANYGYVNCHFTSDSRLGVVL